MNILSFLWRPSTFYRQFIHIYWIIDGHCSFPVSSIRFFEELKKENFISITFLVNCGLDLHTQGKQVTLWMNCSNYRPVHP